ncbi:MAG: hypothetical protein ACK4UN_12815, partial [Limisphaerales bacterium]
MSEPIYIGKRPGWETEDLFGIQTDDQRRHIYTVGKTGTGKTTLLRNLLIQHINAGHGVGL